MMSANDFMSGAEVASMMFSAVPSLLINIVTYVFTALGLYTIAKRRGIHKPWLAWIPVADVWILGSISDQYRYVTRGEVRAKRKSLLVLNILIILIGLTMVGMGIYLVVQIFAGMSLGYNEEELITKIIGPAIGTAAMSVPLVGVAIAMAVIQYMALYDLYASCDPDNKVLFLVLSIFISITLPFFVFFSRNKDYGMPPRQNPAAQQYLPQQMQYRQPYQQPDYQQPDYQQPPYRPPYDEEPRWEDKGGDGPQFL